MRRAAAGGVVLALLAAAPPAAAIEGLSSAIRFDYSSSDKDLSDRRDLVGAVLQARLEHAFSEDLKGVVDGRVGSSDFCRGDAGHLRVNEAYIAKRFEHADLRIGQQIVAWGRADGLNPTDNLTPHDFKVLLPLESDQRFGTIAAKLDVYPAADYRVSVFATPFFQPSVFPLPIPAGTTTIERTPERDAQNTEIAVKLEHTGGYVDWSVSWFHGFSLLPSARAEQFAPVPLLSLNYPEMDVLGADFARNYGNLGLRAEIAYIYLHRDQATGSERLEPSVFYVIGGDRAFGSFNVNLQFVGRHVQNYQGFGDIVLPPLRQIALQNAVTFGQRDASTYAITLRVSKHWLNEKLEGELLLYAGLNREDTYVRPLVSYAFTDRLKGRVGAELYGGGPDTFFGRLQKNERVFAELQYSF